MKNYRIILGSFIVSALFLSSCQDIDLLPKDNMPDELFWKTRMILRKRSIGSTHVPRRSARRIRIAISPMS